MSCDDRYGEESKGKEAARFGARFDHEHNERMRQAQWDGQLSDSCDSAYARGYDGEILRRDKERREEEMRLEMEERESMERAHAERQYAEDMYEQEHQAQECRDDDTF